MPHCLCVKPDDQSLITDHYFYQRGVGRGGGFGRDLGVGVALGVEVGVAVGVGVGLGVTLGHGVGVGGGVPPGRVKAYTLLSPATKIRPRATMPVVL